VDGTGRAASILFTRLGAKVLLVDSVEENAVKTLETIKAEGGEASIYVGDVSSSADCQEMVEAAVTRYGRLNVLFNNAAIFDGPGSVVDIDEDAWQRVMDVNLKGVMLTSKYAIPQMIRAGGGSIINVSSIDGLRANAVPMIAYAASKGGVITLTRHTAVHHGPDNIRVNCIMPGQIFSSMVSNISPELREFRRKAGPLGVEGTAWDIAWAAVFFASDESRWISGTVLPVEGGLLAATRLSLAPTG